MFVNPNWYAVDDGEFALRELQNLEFVQIMGVRAPVKSGTKGVNRFSFKLRNPRCSSFPFSIVMFLSVLCLIGLTGATAIPTNSIEENEGITESGAEELETTKSRPPKNITTFNMDTIDSLQVVEDHIQDEDYASAEAKLAELWTNEAELTLSEKAELSYMSSRISYIQQDLEATITHLEDVLEFKDNIAYAREEEVLLRLAKLYLSEKEHVKAHTRLNEWLEIAEEPKARDLAFAGDLFVKIKSYTRAQEYLERAIEKQEENGLEVDSRWSELLDYVEKKLKTEN